MLHLTRTHRETRTHTPTHPSLPHMHTLPHTCTLTSIHHEYTLCTAAWQEEYGECFSCASFNVHTQGAYTLVHTHLHTCTRSNTSGGHSLYLFSIFLLFSYLFVQECPVCRAECVSRQQLRRDTHFDALVSALLAPVTVSGTSVSSAGTSHAANAAAANAAPSTLSPIVSTPLQTSPAPAAHLILSHVSPAVVSSTSHVSPPIASSPAALTLALTPIEDIATRLAERRMKRQQMQRYQPHVREEEEEQKEDEEGDGEEVWCCTMFFVLMYFRHFSHALSTRKCIRAQLNTCR